MEEIIEFKKTTFIMVNPNDLKEIFRNIKQEEFEKFVKKTYPIEVEININTGELY